MWSKYFWVKNFKDGQYHLMTPKVMIPLLGKITCGQSQPHILDILQQPFDSCHDPAGFCPICLRYYLEYSSYGRQVALQRDMVRQKAARQVNKWKRQQQEAQAPQSIHRGEQDRTQAKKDEKSLSVQAKDRAKERLLRAKEPVSDAEHRAQKAQDAMLSHQSNLTRERSDFAVWYTEVQDFTIREVVRPGHVITVQDSETGEEFEVYLAESDPCRTFQSELYR